MAYSKKKSTFHQTTDRMSKWTLHHESSVGLALEMCGRHLKQFLLKITFTGQFWSFLPFWTFGRYIIKKMAKCPCDRWKRQNLDFWAVQARNVKMYDLLPAYKAVLNCAGKDDEIVGLVHRSKSQTILCEMSKTRNHARQQVEFDVFVRWPKVHFYF